MRKRILIIDDEKSIRLSLKEGLEDCGYKVTTAKDSKEGLKKLKENMPHLIILDIRLPDKNGIEMINEINSIDNECYIIVVTAYGSTKDAVKAIKEGAFDYIEKPFDFDELNLVLKKAIQTIEMKREIIYLRKQQEDYFKGKRIIGESQAMKEVYEKIRLIAEQDTVTVLITGETGVGKEIIAREIHEKSSRKDKPFVDINCGSIPKDLLESELFGFEKHAFTGANIAKKGLFEIADGGTIFLDEIGEMTLEMQVKLLRFLEIRRFKKVGGLKNLEVDVRIITATNKDLINEVANYRFREDLYYRLNVVPIYIPPLRERDDDVVYLANFFLSHYNKLLKKNIKGFSSEVLDIFRKYKWPGNVRELKNIVERMVLFGETNRAIEKGQLPNEVIDSKNLDNYNSLSIFDISDINDFNSRFSLSDAIERIERNYINYAIKEAMGNKTKAARILGISRFALLRRLEKYGITIESNSSISHD